VLVKGPAHGTASIAADGSFTYTPKSGFAGKDTFTYATVDPDGTTSTPATVTITVVTTKQNFDEFYRIRASLRSIVASEHAIARSTAKILAHSTDQTTIGKVNGLLARAAAMVANAEKADKTLSSKKLTAASVTGISDARRTAAAARKLAAQARRLAAESHHTH
jgi:hypothetical protein